MLVSGLVTLASDQVSKQRPVNKILVTKIIELLQQDRLNRST